MTPEIAALVTKMNQLIDVRKDLRAAWKNAVKERAIALLSTSNEEAEKKVWRVERETFERFYKCSKEIYQLNTKLEDLVHVALGLRWADMRRQNDDH